MFTELTESQKGFIVNLIEYLNTGNYDPVFLAHSSLKGPWKVTLQSKERGTENPDLESLPLTGLKLLADLGYLTLVSKRSGGIKMYEAELTQKAFSEVEKYEAPKVTDGYPPIFINYRRSDSEQIAGRIDNDLSNKFGNEIVFIDYKAIGGGEDFEQEALERAKTCKIFLPLIGDKWLGTIYETGSQKGMRRLDDPNDLVRREIETALSHNKIVIPIRLQKTPIPSEEDLPDSLKSIVKRNWMNLRYGADYPNDIDAIIQTIEGKLETLRSRVESKEIPKPDLALKIFTPFDESLRDEVVIKETNNSNHPFGIALINGSQVLARDIKINIDIYWDGNESNAARGFRASQEWTADVSELKNTQEAVLSFVDTNLSSVINHPIRWSGFRLRIERPRELYGSFRLFFTVTSLTPYVQGKGELKITLSESCEEKWA